MEAKSKLCHTKTYMSANRPIKRCSLMSEVFLHVPSVTCRHIPYHLVCWVLPVPLSDTRELTLHDRHAHVLMRVQ